MHNSSEMGVYPTLSVPVLSLERPVDALRVDEELSAVVGGEGASSVSVCGLVLDRLHRLHDLALVNVLGRNSIDP